ncbi:MAG: glycosidase [Candidatus Saccharibacteria bacterium]|nr:glycosidase [Candidatus Saccharibacteria bacterium]
MTLNDTSNQQDQQICFTRINGKPLIEPDPELNWEAGGVFAPAVVLENGKWKMLYRAFGKDGISRIGYAESDDGIDWNKDKKPRVIPDHTGLEYSGIEDPRIVHIDGRYLISYTAYAKQEMPVQTRIRILETTDFHKFEHVTPSFEKQKPQNDKDGVLFSEKINGLYYMLHRLEPNIQLSTSTDLKKWTKFSTVLKPTQNDWESLKIGAGSPPIKTPIGWLFFYHGVSHDMKYSMGAAILNLKAPTEVLYRLPYPLLSPGFKYEEAGVVPNVVFGTSVVELISNYYLYYGAADDVIAAALIDKSDLLKTIVKYPVN